MADDYMDKPVAVGIPPEEGKFCADCKYLVGVRYKTEDATNWNCGHPKNSMWEKPNLITGIKKRVFIRTLQVLRYDASRPESKEFCGQEGKWYELYEEPKREPLPERETPVPEYKPGTMKPAALAALTKKKKIGDLGMDDL